MSKRLENLDALRGLTAMSVLVQHLLSHVWRAMPNGTHWLKAIGLDYFDWGRFGVVLFFLISGYVIPLSFSEPTPVRKFIVSRAFRLYPAFWLSVLVMGAVIVFGGQALESVRKHHTGLQSFRSMRRIEARRRNASALRLRHSQSLAKSSASVEPGDGALDDPSFWQDDEGVQFVALDDFDDPICRSFGRRPAQRAAPDSRHRRRCAG